MKRSIPKNLNKLQVMKNVIDWVKECSLVVEKDIVKQVMLELILNAQSYGVGPVSVEYDWGANYVLFKVENKGFIMDNPAMATNGGRVDGLINIILANSVRGNYGLYDIIKDMGELGGEVTIITGFRRIKFLDIDKYFVSERDYSDKVIVEVYFEEQGKRTGGQ